MQSTEDDDECCPPGEPTVLETVGLHICAGDSARLFVASVCPAPYETTYVWSPALYIDDIHAACPRVYPPVTTAYTVTVCHWTPCRENDTPPACQKGVRKSKRRRKKHRRDDKEDSCSDSDDGARRLGCVCRLKYVVHVHPVPVLASSYADEDIPTVCRGQQRSLGAQLRFPADARTCTFQWTPATGLDDPSRLDAVYVGPPPPLTSAHSVLGSEMTSRDAKGSTSLDAPLTETHHARLCLMDEPSRHGGGRFHGRRPLVAPSQDVVWTSNDGQAAAPEDDVLLARAFIPIPVAMTNNDDDDGGGAQFRYTARFRSSDTVERNVSLTVQTEQDRACTITRAMAPRTSVEMLLICRRPSLWTAAYRTAATLPWIATLPTLTRARHDGGGIQVLWHGALTLERVEATEYTPIRLLEPRLIEYRLNATCRDGPIQCTASRVYPVRLCDCDPPVPRIDAYLCCDDDSGAMTSIQGCNGGGGGVPYQVPRGQCVRLHGRVEGPTLADAESFRFEWVLDPPAPLSSVTGPRLVLRIQHRQCIRLAVRSVDTGCESSVDATLVLEPVYPPQLVLRESAHTSLRDGSVLFVCQHDGPVAVCIDAVPALPAGTRVAWSSSSSERGSTPWTDASECVLEAASSRCVQHVQHATKTAGVSQTQSSTSPAVPCRCTAHIPVGNAWVVAECAFTLVFLPEPGPSVSLAWCEPVRFMNRDNMAHEDGGDDERTLEHDRFEVSEGQPLRVGDDLPLRLTLLTAKPHYRITWSPAAHFDDAHVANPFFSLYRHDDGDDADGANVAATEIRVAVHDPHVGVTAHGRWTVEEVPLPRVECTTQMLHAQLDADEQPYERAELRSFARGRRRAADDYFVRGESVTAEKALDPSQYNLDLTQPSVAVFRVGRITDARHVGRHWCTLMPYVHAPEGTPWAGRIGRPHVLTVRVFPPQNLGEGAVRTVFSPWGGWKRAWQRVPVDYEYLGLLDDGGQDSSKGTTTGHRRDQEAAFVSREYEIMWMADAVPERHVVHVYDPSEPHPRVAWVAEGEPPVGEGDTTSTVVVLHGYFTHRASRLAFRIVVRLLADLASECHVAPAFVYGDEQGVAMAAARPGPAQRPQWHMETLEKDARASSSTVASVCVSVSGLSAQIRPSAAARQRSSFLVVSITEPGDESGAQDDVPPRCTAPPSAVHFGGGKRTGSLRLPAATYRSGTRVSVRNGAWELVSVHLPGVRRDLQWTCVPPEATDWVVYEWSDETLRWLRRRRPDAPPDQDGVAAQWILSETGESGVVRVVESQ